MNIADTRTRHRERGKLPGHNDKTAGQGEVIATPGQESATV